jgi:hypothetical protein
MNRHKWSYRALGVGALVLAASLHAAEQDEFAQRCDAYQALRADAVKGLPKLGKDAKPEEIKNYRESLRSRMSELRSEAKPGEILTPAVFEVVAAVRSETAGAQGKAVRETVLGDGNPAKEGVRVPLKINAPYDAPLSTVPPDLLARLPELPENLQYRFVGKSLILYDVEAEMVVDYISGAVN